MSEPDKLSIVVFSGELDKVHYALVMAAAAAAVNKPATLFFTMEATRALLKPYDDGAPSWWALPVSTPHQSDGASMDNDYSSAGIATFEELLSSCVALGVTFMVCEMGLKAMDLKHADLRDDVPIKMGGVVSYLGDASSSGHSLFI